MFNMVRRSFLAARTRPVLSNLNAGVRHHVCGGGSMVSVSNSRANQTLSRRYWSDYSVQSDGSVGKNRPDKSNRCGQCGRPNRQRKHLYVVLDDWKEGFSVHKLDLGDKLDEDADKASLSMTRNYQRLLPSPVRIAFSGLGAGIRFAAMGRKIVACTEGQHGLTVVYDTDTAGLSMVRHSPDALHYHWEVALAAVDGLYAIVSKPKCRPSNDSSGSANSVLRCSRGEMFCFEEVIEHPEEAFTLDDMYYDDNRVGTKCAWRMDPASVVPFDLCHGGVVRSYAVDPGGNRFYVSVTPAKHFSSNTGYYGDDIPDLTKAQKKAAEMKAGTYTYHVKTREWTHLGTWMLPFAGQGYYDPELDTWVGFDMDCDGNHCKIGSCDIPNRAWGNPDPPTWKLCEKDFSLAKTWPQHNTNVLVGLGSGKFCLIQSKPRNGVHDSWGDGDKFELHVTIFRARYDKNGELTITDRRLVSSYLLSRTKDVVWYWISRSGSNNGNTGSQDRDEPLYNWCLRTTLRQGVHMTTAS